MTIKLRLTTGITLFVILFFTQAFAQQLPTVVPPSPEATSVFKFSEVPVSLHTGLPNINIPLLEIESGGVTIPISISYHSRGIQVAEISSRVGTGWTLNASGMISRQMRGFYDELSTCGYGDYFSNFNKRLQIINTESAGGELAQRCDLIPDQYYFSVANGLNGKFVFYRGEVHVQKYSNIEVMGTDSIKDGKGNTYYFGNSVTDIDYTTQNITLSEITGISYDNNPQSLTAPNTWHLTKILTQTGKEITYTYENENFVYYRRLYDKYDNQVNLYPEPIDSPPNAPYQNISYVSQINTNQNRIRRITFEEGKVEFEYQAREDSGGGCLKKIILFKKNENGYIQIKEILFGYIYTNSSTIDNISNTHSYWLNNQQARKRLFLKTIQFVSQENDLIPLYRFEYNPEILPNRFSNSQDIWGYYNGKNNGMFLSDNFGHSNPGKVVDTVKAEAGLLKKIIYPTGGSANFLYEHNRVYNYFPKKMVFESPNPIENKDVILSHIDANFNDAPINPTVPIYSSSAIKYVKTFVIPESAIGPHMEYMVNFGDSTGCAYPNNIDCEFSVTILGVVNGINYGLYITSLNEFRQINALPAGTYQLIVKPKSSNHDPLSDTFIVGFKWEQETILPNEPIYAAGKRIKKIAYHTALNDIAFFKTYSYLDPETGKSSGLLLGLPNFYTLNEKYSADGFHTMGPFGSIPGSPLSTYQENSLGYGIVTEYFGEGNNTIGKTVYEYSMVPDTGLYYDFPYHPPTDNSWLRGLELNVTHYKRNDNSSFSPVRKIENEYLYGGYTSPPDYNSTPAVFNPIPITKNLVEDLDFPSLDYFKDENMFRLPLAITTRANPYDLPPNANVYGYKTYHLTGGALDLLRTITTDYFDNNSNIETIVDYRYNYDNHYNLSFSIQSTSDPAISIYSRYSYATNIETKNQDMIDSNILDIPIRIQKSEVLANKLWEETTTYKKWIQGNNSFLAPELIKTSKGTNSPESRIRYNRYDDKGNPLEVQQENGTLISYIWGYNQSHPIAKIENGSYQEVEQYVANLQSLSNGTNETGLISGLNNLRTQFPNALITTYTYKPLVGVSTITDPRGYTITYEYDDFGRLELVKDADKNILEETNYHYRP